jgi:hypothetical protein
VLTTATTVPGEPGTDNEDWYGVTPELVIVLDGATVRSETGCEHGLVWYVQHLGTALSRFAAGTGSLQTALAVSIAYVAAQHPGCDLTAPGTPSAAVGMVRTRNGIQERLVLGDVTVVTEMVDPDAEISVVSDTRVSATAAELRAEADRYPLGSPQKRTAILAMKPHELAARNIPGGYWIAAADPRAALEALCGEVPVSEIRRFAVMTDGAARFIDMFDLAPWRRALNYLEVSGPQKFIDSVRAAEAADPQGIRFPRNKHRDDATVVFGGIQAPRGGELAPLARRQALANTLLDRLNAVGVTGADLRRVGA